MFAAIRGLTILEVEALMSAFHIYILPTSCMHFACLLAPILYISIPLWVYCYFYAD